MPDITMCLNKKCPSKDKCYRFMANPTPFNQSYSDFKPIKSVDYTSDRCDMFMKVTKPKTK